MAVNGLLITDNERKMIMRTWRYLSDDMTGRGVKLFMLIFEKNAAVKNMFSFRDETGDDLLEHPFFKTHASHFMEGIGAAVDNMDSLNKLTPLLLELGQQHCHTQGFSEAYFELFISCLLQVWQEELDSMFTPEVKVAWEKMFYFIMMKLRAGYDAAISKQQLELQEADDGDDDVGSTRDSGG